MTPESLSPPGFWEEILSEKDSPGQARVGGKCFTIKPDMPEGTAWYKLGHAGREFHFRFFDGREVVSHNAWSRGLIPEEYKDQLPDNAELIEKVDPRLEGLPRYGLAVIMKGE